MKRKMLNAMVGVAMLGAAASANAFLFTSTTDLNGTVLAAGARNNLGSGAPGFSFDMKLKAGDTIDIMVPAWATTLTADGQFGLDYKTSPVNPTPDGFVDFFRNYNNRTVFEGEWTASVTGVMPTHLDTGSASVAPGNSVVIDYDGTFSTFPLLGISGTGAGRLTISWWFNTAIDTLFMDISESNLSGWTGFETALQTFVKNETGYPGPASTITKFGAEAWLGDVVGYNAQNPIRASADGTFKVTAVPEPASLALLGIGIAGLGFMRRRKS